VSNPSAPGECTIVMKHRPTEPSATCALESAAGMLAQRNEVSITALKVIKSFRIRSPSFPRDSAGMLLPGPYRISVPRPGLGRFDLLGPSMRAEPTSKTDAQLNAEESSQGRVSCGRPLSLSIFGHRGESIKIRGCSRESRSWADPESGSKSSDSPKSADSRRSWSGGASRAQLPRA
jgi:hypothetical protein